MRGSRWIAVFGAGFVCAAGSLSWGAVGASAAPSTPSTLTYELTGCVGPAGTPSSIDGVKQPSGAAALHLENGTRFIFMKAVDAVTGEVFFETKGFDHNGLPTVTCDLVHPVTKEASIVTGLVTPVR